MLVRYAINVLVLALLLTFAFAYQTDRNQERLDSRFEVSAFLFGAEDRSNSALQKDIETTEEFLDALKGIVTAYYDAPESGSGAFMHHVYGERNSTPIAPVLEITYHEGYYGSAEYASVVTKSFNLLEANPLGPFADPRSLVPVSEPCEPVKDADGAVYISCRASILGEFFDRVVSMRLSFSLYSLMRRPDGSPSPRVWWLDFDFRLAGHSSVMSMDATLKLQDRQSPERLPVMVCSALLLLVALGFLLRIRTFPRFSTPVGQVIRLVNKLCEEQQLIPDSERADECPEGGWRYLGFISDVWVISFTVIALTNQFLAVSNASMEEAATILLGFSTLFCCARLVSILVLFPSLYVVVDAIVMAGRQLSMYAVAVFPILLGYSICGLAVFGAYGGYFGTLPLSMVSLVCANFGDNLIDTFLEIDQSPYLVNLIFDRIFFTTFLLFFICNVLNVAHSIIQDSYFYAVRTFAASARDDSQSNVPSITAEELNDILAKFRGDLPSNERFS